MEMNTRLNAKEERYSNFQYYRTPYSTVPGTMPVTCY